MAVQRKGNVAIISIVRPESIEKLAWLSDELIDICAKVAWDEQVRVIILTGDEENAFCFNPDLTVSAIKEGGGGTPPLFFAESIGKLKQPTVAAINGDAVGQGFELALACDIRIAAETSRFALPHIQQALIPWDGGTQRLTRLIGKGKTLEMILAGEVVDAQEAYRIGLVNQVVPVQKLMNVTINLAEQMASKGPIALRYAKEAIYKGMDMTLEQGLRLEVDLYCLLHSTKDRTEGIEAFREKRTPKFEGR
jgi:enoyl-CoA hydratase/carnithine racemase